MRHRSDLVSYPSYTLAPISFVRTGRCVFLYCNGGASNTAPSVMRTAIARAEGTLNVSNRALDTCSFPWRYCRTRRARFAGRIKVGVPVSATAQPGPSSEVHRLKAKQITAESFKSFGQLCGPVSDGKQYDDQDAQLTLDRGTPRFYIMRLPSRGLAFDRITYHAGVTQCLGGLGEQPWYMAVAKPTGSLEAWPQLSDLQAFRIPPGVFIKLHQATWHAGPFFPDGQHMDFYNLELADTNVVDHHTHVYDRRIAIVP